MTDTVPTTTLPAWPLPTLKQRSIETSPFRYAICVRCINPELGDALLAWFEGDAPWGLARTDFYEQCEFSCWDNSSPLATFLTSREVLELVRAEMGEIFDRTFEDGIDVVCHRLLPTQKIGIHNDYIAGQETHRLTIQVNRGLTDSDGGVLMLFSGNDATDVHKLLHPLSLSGFAFEISADSHHAVSQVHGGARFSVIYSLRALSDC
jgi:hypothetical protein